MKKKLLCKKLKKKAWKNETRKMHTKRSKVSWKKKSSDKIRDNLSVGNKNNRKQQRNESILFLCDLNNTWRSPRARRKRANYSVAARILPHCVGKVGGFIVAGAFFFTCGKMMGTVAAAARSRATAAISKRNTPSRLHVSGNLTFTYTTTLFSVSFSFVDDSV